ncbi:MAG: biotin--[acetyl-CoA-carboxylase] ligase [Desulfovibrio sp.]|nr:biotin--[acetyl-CoA-carboxylase] ligase [Desulfovibrio sp.]
MIHYFDKVSSTMDEASSLAAKGELKVWDSVVARVQTMGRGQLRKGWVSPPGNLYASLRLPVTRTFASSLGAIAATALFLPPLEALAGELFIKWPNDIIAIRDGETKKLAGILLEEKRGALIAGIGTNIDAPKVETKGLGLPPVGLRELRPKLPDLSPLEIWIKILAHIRAVDASNPRELIASKLLWLDHEIEMIDGDERITGIFRGINEEGGAIVETTDEILTFFSGSMREAKR